jgi:glutamate carboxypeptidase
VGLSEIAPLRLVIVSDEEVGSPEGAGILREAARGAGASLVFESGRDKDAIITRRKGTGAITAVAHGRAAHAGNGHKEGANAIWAMARFVDRVQQLTDYEQGITVNVGKIGGGQGKNTVPDHVEALADMRFCTQADAEALIAKVQAAAEQAGASLANTRVEVDAKVLRPPLERTEGNVALMEAYAAAAKVCGLGFGEAGLIGGGSDASTTSAIGIPSIDGLGPRGKGFHTVEEMIEVNTLIPKAQALARYLAAARY